MRAVVLNGTGGPEMLAVEDVAEPTPGDAQAIVDVRACGINFADILIRLGRYPQMPELPAVLGFEVAGELDGNRVMGFVRAEVAATPSGSSSTVAGSCHFLRARASRKARHSRWRFSPRGFRSRSCSGSASEHACW